jgi:hypothetical protein
MKNLETQLKAEVIYSSVKVLEGGGGERLE